MNIEQFKARYFTPLEQFAKSDPTKNAVPELPARFEWMHGQLHPLVLASLCQYMNSTHETYHFGLGRCEEGLFLSVTDDRDDEQLRLTCRTDVQNVCDQLATLHTTDRGVWLLPPGIDEPPEAIYLPSLYNTPFGKLRSVFQAVERFGGDDSLDIRHRGTYLLTSLYHESRITEYFDVGSAVWELTYRQPISLLNTTVQSLSTDIYGALEQDYPLAVVRVGSRVLIPDSTHFFEPTTPAVFPDRNGSLPEDAMVIVEGVREHQTIIPPYVTSQALVVKPQLEAMIEEDDESILGRVARCLLEGSGEESYQVVQIIEAPIDAHTTFRVIDRDMMSYNVKVKK